MTRTYYQTHGHDKKGMVDSEARLERLKIPADLTGQRVLDIGCNEGFFCNVARERNAAEVVGIDGNLPFLEVARELYSAPNVEFRHQRWDNLPDGPFDLVLWTSSMHYELDPSSVFSEIRRRLSPDALFILECGVLSWPGKEMVLRQRRDDSRWYPTSALLESMLGEHFAYRATAPGTTIPGDATPRVVYHCHPRVPVVVLLRGHTQQGKTYLGTMLRPVATKVIPLDGVLRRISLGEHFNSEFERFVHRVDEAGQLTNIYSIIDQEGMVDEYVEVLSRTVTRSDELVIIEGHLTDEQAEALTRKLAPIARVWDMARRA